MLDHSSPALTTGCQRSHHPAEHSLSFFLCSTSDVQTPQPTLTTTTRCSDPDYGKGPNCQTCNADRCLTMKSAMGAICSGRATYCLAITNASVLLGTCTSCACNTTSPTGATYCTSTVSAQATYAILLCPYWLGGGGGGGGGGRKTAFPPRPHHRHPHCPRTGEFWFSLFPQALATPPPPPPPQIQKSPYSLLALAILGSLLSPSCRNWPSFAIPAPQCLFSSRDKHCCRCQQQTSVCLRSDLPLSFSMRLSF